MLLKWFHAILTWSIFFLACDLGAQDAMMQENEQAKQHERTALVSKIQAALMVTCGFYEWHSGDFTDAGACFFFARLRGRDDPEALHGRLPTEGSRANGTYTARQLLNAGAPNLQRITMCHGCQAKKKVMQGGLSFELIFRNIEWRFDEAYDEFIWIL